MKMLGMRNEIINGGDLAMMDFDLSQPETPVQCPLCATVFVVVPDSQPLQQHLILEHRLIIAKIDEIADLRQYLMYWGKLSGAEMTQFCSAIITNSEKSFAEGVPERYFLLSDHLPEDKRLRDMLREIKLKLVTRAKEQERADTSFRRKCVYCYKIISGGLHEMFNHLTNVHNFSIGKPDNIVYGAKLLDAIEAKLQKLLCVYCEKQFTDVDVLRLHMRKKGHRSLNPNNRFYDQFYLINYLQPGTPWQEVKSQRDDETESQESFTGDTIAGGVGVCRSLDDQWTDWREDEAQSAPCLFCSYTTCKLPGGLLQHMSSQHDCDLLQLTHNFSFYDKVKAVNYIRSMMKQLLCPACAKSCGDEAALLEHLRAAGHCKLPTPALWCTAKYLQPVLTEDGLLCHLDDCPEAELSAMTECEVFSEDVSSPATVSEDVARELSVEVQRVSCVSVVCLFCRYTALGGPTVGCNGVRELVQHMHSMHGFDLYQMTLGKEFYEQLCLINYIRRRSSESRCYYCGEHFLDPRLLEEHRTVQGHTGAPDPALYRKLEFMTPVLADDPLLMGLDQPSWNSDSELEDEVRVSQPVEGDAGRKKGLRNSKNTRKNGQAKNSLKSPVMLPDAAAQSLMRDMNDGLQSALSSSKENTCTKNPFISAFARNDFSSVDGHEPPPEMYSNALPRGATDENFESSINSRNLYNSSWVGLECLKNNASEQNQALPCVYDAASGTSSLRSIDLSNKRLLRSSSDNAMRNIPTKLVEYSSQSIQRLGENSEQIFYPNKFSSPTDGRISDTSLGSSSRGNSPTVENNELTSGVNNGDETYSEGASLEVTNSLKSLSLSIQSHSRAFPNLVNREEPRLAYVPPARLQMQHIRNPTSVASSSAQSRGVTHWKSAPKRSFCSQNTPLPTHQRRNLSHYQTKAFKNFYKTEFHEFELLQSSSASGISPSVNVAKLSVPARDFNASWRRPPGTSERQD